MAVYKVIQDIEAEDKLIGPFTLKQFLFLIAAVGCIFFGGLLGRINPILAMPFLPPLIVFGFLAAPLGREQPNEIWLAARIRFFLKPKRRIWDQAGLKELVTVTAPKQIERVYSDNLSQTEVRSRLSALADTMDSRGWAVKNVNVNMYTHPSFAAAAQSDRLVAPAAAPSAHMVADVQASDDILDSSSNPVAQNFDRMMQEQAQEHRQQVIQQMQQVASGEPAPSGGPPKDFWFMYQNEAAPAAPGYTTFGSQVVTPGSTAPPGANAPLLSKAKMENEEEAGEELKHHEQPGKSHLKTILPLSEQAKQKRRKKIEAAKDHTTQNSAPATPGNPPMTATPPPAILELANINDWSVATLAQQAKRVQEQDPADGEVVVSLH